MIECGAAKVLICGSRDWTDRGLIHDWIARLPKGTIVIHGGAKGADRIAGEEAEAFGLEVRVYPANWTLHGDGAGPKRNAQMLAENPDIDRVLAFTWVVEGTQGVTRGSGDMVIKALAAGVRVTIIPPRRG